MQRRDFVKTGLVGGAALTTPMADSMLNLKPGKGTFVHCVYFWLKDSLTDKQKLDFEKGLDSLVGIESVQHGFYGRPAGTDRAIIDRSYAYGLVAVFENVEGHDAYQVHEVHDVFRETYGDFWTDVKIYDFVIG